jgi:hypothetical protein
MEEHPKNQRESACLPISRGFAASRCEQQLLAHLYERLLPGQPIETPVDLCEATHEQGVAA